MTKELTHNWLDRAIAYVSPRAGLRRMQARVALDAIRHYEAASTGRRTQGWRSNIADANAAVGFSLSRLREVARDLVRNNGYAESALTTIGDQVVGWGITAKTKGTRNAAAEKVWEEWAGTTACDSDGRNDMAGLQKLVMRTTVESGECLIRRRIRRPEDDLPIPLQIQVLEPDYIDTLKTGINITNDQTGQIVGRIIHGIEYNILGRRVAYWMFSEHPGSAQGIGTFGGGFESRRIPATEILHVFKQSRPGQVRGPSWFAPVLLRFKDFDEYEDATLMKQKIAACLAVITSDTDGLGTPIGVRQTTTSGEPEIDRLEPGLIHRTAPGSSVEVVQPPSVADYPEYSKTSLRAIATGLGVAYEDLTGDYTNLPFSAARMSRIRHWARVEDWRWRVLVPQFCDPVWAWAMQAAQIMSRVTGEAPRAVWTPPAAPFIDPGAEGLAIMRNIRAGIQSLSEALRERGYDPKEVLAEIAADNALLDKLGIILDSDPRNTTQAGNPRQIAQAAPAEPDADEGDGGKPPKGDKGKTPPAGGDGGDGEDDAEDKPARLARIELLAELVLEHLRATKPQAVNIRATTTIEKGAIQSNVTSPTTIAEGAIQTAIAPGAIRLDQPITVAPAELTIEKGAIVSDNRTTIAEGAIRTEVPITVADDVHIPAGRKVFERDQKTGRLAAVVAEAEVPAGIHVTGIRRGKKRETNGE